MKTNPNDATFSNACDVDGNPTLGYGLTKREYFAAMAMQGLLAKSTATKEMIAEMAVEHAEALINELNKGEQK